MVKISIGKDKETFSTGKDEEKRRNYKGNLGEEKVW